MAHASGEWISSDWPVCPVSEIGTPHRMGKALTYARRYALFALVGIAGEDDLDAPDEPAPAVDAPASGSAPTSRKTPNGSIHKPRQPKPVLATEPSARLRDQLIGEIQTLQTKKSLRCGRTAGCRPRTRSEPTMQAPSRPPGMSCSAL